MSEKCKRKGENCYDFTQMWCKDCVELLLQEERLRIEEELDKHIAPKGLSLETAVWLKRLLNKVFQHENSTREVFYEPKNK